MVHSLSKVGSCVSDGQGNSMMFRFAVTAFTALSVTAGLANDLAQDEIDSMPYCKASAYIVALEKYCSVRYVDDLRFEDLALAAAYQETLTSISESDIITIYAGIDEATSKGNAACNEGIAYVKAAARRAHADLPRLRTLKKQRQLQ